MDLQLRRTFFDSLLAQAVPSSFDPARFANEDEWANAVATSEVRLQWDPDHDPFGNKQERRAIQIGLRGSVLEAMGKRELLEVIDLTEFVADQRRFVGSHDLEQLHTIRERVYTPADQSTITRLGLSEIPSMEIDQ